MQIEFNVLDRQFFKYQGEYEAAALRVLRSGWYILGQEVEAFEAEFAAAIGSRCCVGVNSGLDALILAFRALGIGPGDEVLVPANTYIASVIGITENGATPVYVEPDLYYNLNPDLLEAAITVRTKAILAVHLYGQAARMDAICDIAKKHKLLLIEDCAQSHTAAYKGQITGTFGDIGCFSFFPTKNLGAFGDGGAIVTDDLELATKIRMMRNYGSKVKYHNEIAGVNSRLDEMQAGLLRVKLNHLPELIAERTYIAARYLNEINNPLITLPSRANGSAHVWHLFVARTAERNKLQQYLLDNGIKTQIHYPVPPHLAECYRYQGHKKCDYPITEDYANSIISLPLYNGMTEEEIECVIAKVNTFDL